MSKHAILSPSSFKALMLCPAKPAMERGRPDRSSEYADEGTAAHFLASWCLLQDRDNAHDLIGDTIVVDTEGEAYFFDPDNRSEGDRLFEVTHEMVDAVQTYLDTVRDLAGGDGEILVEQALPIGHITGEQGAEGTGDAVILRGNEIIVVDFKYGRGVEVDADNNPQLMLYALGALERFGMVEEFETARMVISQPRLRAAPSEWSCTVEDLVEWGRTTATPAAIAAADLLACDLPVACKHCRPHEDACRFCSAKADCPALAAKVEQAIGLEFTDLTTADATQQDAIVEDAVDAASVAGQLGTRMDAVPLVEMWCKAIRGKVEGELLAGRPVAGYKLVQGRKPARAWSDAELAEATLKKMRLKADDMYERKLISPTSAEKLLKPTPKKWAKVSALITQGEGSPSVAPVSDKRPALKIAPVSSEFQPIAEEALA